MNLNKFKDHLLFLPLGGSGEIGMNLNLYHLDGKWIVVDCGIGFADEYYPGADIIVPDTEFIEQIKDDIIAMVITHAHEDHVGAIPYIWPDFECPIYTTKFTANFLRLKLAETHFKKKVKIIEIEPNKNFTLGPFEIEPMGLTHSIPEMQALAIKTRLGTVMHTGDWKFDDGPVIGPAPDYKNLKKAGDAGVLALVCDSTNVFSEGVSGSEEDVQKNLIRIIEKCEQRVAVGAFASNLARLSSIIKAGQAAGREIIICGRSFWRIIEAAKESGYLKDCPTLHSDRDIGKIPRQKQLLLCTGSQAEPRAAFTRITEGSHPNVKLTKGDTAIFSSKIIPGNEKGIFRMLNQLTLDGIEIITEKNEFIHVSGHPYRDELKKMYELTRPKVAMPVHGEARHIHEHAEFALEQGAEIAFRPQNGEVYSLAPSIEKVGLVHAGKLAIDGPVMYHGDAEVMRLRRKMRVSGAFFVSILVTEKGACNELPQISAPGLLDEEEDADLIATIADEIQFMVQGSKDKKAILQQVRKAVKKFIRNEMGKHPAIEVHVVRS